MWEPTPWVVGGGAEHSPEVARVLAYASTSGAEGIVTPGDLKVSALPVAGGAVRVAPGAALIRNRFAGGGQQTYAARNTAAHDVEVAATSSGGGRTDLVVARIVDPQYAGEIPNDPTDYQYVRTEIIQGVPAGTSRATDLNLGYPALALARINIPSSTATVTSAMITDVREVALPRTLVRTFAHDIAGGEQISLAATGAEGGIFPNVTDWDLRVPEWATHVSVRGFWSQVWASHEAIHGLLWVRLGDGHDPHGRSWAQSKFTTSVGRSTIVVAAEVPVPAGLRGRFVPTFLMGRHISGGAYLKMDEYSTASLDLQFFEAAI